MLNELNSSCSWIRTYSLTLCTLGLQQGISRKKNRAVLFVRIV